MRSLFTILFLLLGLVMQAQHDTTFITYDKDPYDDTLIYHTDTVFSNNKFRQVVLKGTCVLPYTRKMIGAMAHGFTLKEVAGTPCQNDGPRRPIPRMKDTKIEDVRKENGQLIFETKVIDNCCFDFLCEIEVTKDSILNLVYTGYGDHCACNCCFGLQWTISLDKEDFMQEEIAKIKQAMINGRRETLFDLD